MKAWTIQTHGSADGLALIEQPQPVPVAGEVLVRVRAVSLNYRDLITLQQQRPGNLPPPLVPCSDGAGEVVAVGDGVTRFKAGDRVAGIFFRDWIDGPFELRYHDAAGGGSIHGWLREFVALPERALVPIPEHLSFEEAATLPCAAVTAWQALFTRGDVRSARLVLGTGGVSIFTATCENRRARHRHFQQRREAKRAKLRRVGDDQPPRDPDWDKEVWRLSRKSAASSTSSKSAGRARSASR